MNGGLPPREPDFTSLPRPKGESAFSLLERDLPAPARLCDPWATEGINIIAGRPKLGKTTLARQKMAAAATGGDFLDSKFPTAVKCAFLSLEEGPLLCRHKLIKAGMSEAALTSIEVFFEWPRGAEGIFHLDRYMEENPDVKLICVDSLTRFRSVPDPRQTAFSSDYEAIASLHKAVNKYPGRCVDLIHHTRKMKSDDPIDNISGTYGVGAGVDSYMILQHHADGALMHAGGRLWERDEASYILKRGERDTWQMLGLNLGLTQKQQEALDMTKASANGLSGKELSEAVAITIPSAWQRLDELLEKGLVSKRYGRVYAKT